MTACAACGSYLGPGCRFCSLCGRPVSMASVQPVEGYPQVVEGCLPGQVYPPVTMAQDGFLPYPSHTYPPYQPGVQYTSYEPQWGTPVQAVPLATADVTAAHHQPMAIHTVIEDEVGSPEEMALAFCLCFFFGILAYLCLLCCTRTLYSKAGAAYGFSTSWLFTVAFGVALINNGNGFGFALVVVSIIFLFTFATLGAKYHRAAKSYEENRTEPIIVQQAPSREADYYVQ
eukprot:GGOE01005693.1.p2 GENE.GGOE01005693.1~~GGOE01005693.1.p2  ORF type:complete len:239 (+),score=50.01 GGOE01005693.1:29-718(+)